MKIRKGWAERFPFGRWQRIEGRGELEQVGFGTEGDRMERIGDKRWIEGRKKESETESRK